MQKNADGKHDGAVRHPNPADATHEAAEKVAASEDAKSAAHEAKAAAHEAKAAGHEAKAAEHAKAAAHEAKEAAHESEKAAAESEAAHEPAHKKNHSHKKDEHAHGKVTAAHAKTSSAKVVKDEDKKEAPKQEAHPKHAHKKSAGKKARLVVVRQHWPWFAAGLLVVLLVAAWLIYRHHEAAVKAAHPPQVPPVPITMAAARQGDINITVTAIGTVTPLQTASITARVQGEILRVDYKEGKLVHKGDPLLEIDPRPYQATLAQAKGQLAHDIAVLNEARIDLDRYRNALKLNAVAQQQVSDQAQLVKQDEGTVKMDEGVVQSAAINVAYCHITAPIDGRAGLRLVDPGNIVQSGSTNTLVTIAQLQPITIIFSVAEDYLPQIQDALTHGQGLQVDALDRTEEKKLASGTLLALDNMVDTTTGTVRLRAQFANQDGSLFPNQFVNAKLLVKTIHGVTLIPAAAIQRNAQGAFVYMIDQSQKATLRDIKPGATEGNDAAVEGINPGEMVATSGFNKLKDGVHITTGNGGDNKSGNASTKSANDTPASEESQGHTAAAQQGSAPAGMNADAGPEAAADAGKQTAANAQTEAAVDAGSSP